MGDNRHAECRGVNSLATSLRYWFVGVVLCYFLLNNSALARISISRFDNLLWPLPQQINSSETLYTINSKDFRFVQANFQSELLSRALSRYQSICFFRSKKNKLSTEPLPLLENILPDDKLINSIRIYVDTIDQTLQLDTNETYTLTVQSPEIELRSNTVYGALRGLETFSQLLVFGQDTYYYINHTTIVDFPRFPIRGLLVDTARHFLSLNALYKLLDAMAYTKMNVFHWHLVDDESFPFESVIYPKLAQEGSWSGDSHIYTQGDVQAVIHYAKDRGIRVVPEFDTPGHTRAWGKGYPFIVTQCYSGSKPKTGKDSIGPINPAANTTFPFLRDLFSEISRVFPDNYIHLGGDEVHFECWASNPQIRAWMAQHNFTSYTLLEEYYLTNLLKLVSSLNKSYIVWQEVFDNGIQLDPSTVIHIWKGQWENEMRTVTRAGFRTILSSPWYLNYISYGNDWEKYYNIEPSSFGGSKAQQALLSGGEACMWAEFVDSTNVVARFWPRAATVAEKLWSSQSVNDIDDARERIQVLTCRLISRGIDAEPVVGANFCEVEWDAPYFPPWSR